MKNYQDTENKILGNLLRSPLEGKSLRQIALDTGLSYVTVHKLISVLLKGRLIRLEKKGKANIVSVDFEQAESGRLSSAMLHEKNKFLKKHPKLTILSRNVEDELAGMFYCLILFGSYAQGYPRSDSDIDLFFVVPYRKDIEKYKEKINKALGLIPGKKHLIVVSTEDFMDMLNQKYTVGRAAFQHGLVLFGTEPFYSMVKKHVRTHGY